MEESSVSQVNVPLAWVKPSRPRVCDPGERVFEAAPLVFNPRERVSTIMSYTKMHDSK